MSEKIEQEKLILWMQNIIKRIPSQFYGDLLFDANAVTSIIKSISEETISTIPSTSGFACRIFDGEQWWEFNDIDLNKLEQKVMQKLPEITLSDKIKIIPQNPNHIDKEISMKIDFTKISVDEKLEKIKKIYQTLLKTDDRVINPKVVYKDILTERIFVNTEGSQLRQVIPRSRIMIMPIVKENNRTDYDFDIISRQAGFEIMSEITDERLQKVVQNSIDLTFAPLPPKGIKTAVLDPEVAGLIAHESFGHGLEADQIIRDRSYLVKYYKQKIGNESVNISDSPIEPGAIGSYLFDDEGIIPQKTLLIKNGYLQNYLHNRITASILNELPGGNGRRESFMHPVYPRMSNTYFEPGNYSINEMIQEAKSGVLLQTGSFGMEDPLGGGIQVTSKKGYLIDHGEKTSLIKGMTITGNIVELLNSITAISQGPIKLDGGICGKGSEDFVPVSSGGVFICVKNAIISPG